MVEEIADKKIFDELNPQTQVNEIQSFCVSCEGQGITRLLFTKIPFYKEIILMSFECDCGYKSTEIQPASTLAETGIHIAVNVNSVRDMNRNVVKSEYATIKIPDLDLEIPPITQKGKLTTIEGFIRNAKENVEKTLNDGYYSELGVEKVEKISSFVEKLEKALDYKLLPFHFEIDDPSGNSFVENPFAPNSDPYAKTTYYVRNDQHMKDLGIYTEKDIEEEQANIGKEVVGEKKHKILAKHAYTEEEEKALLEKASKYKSNNPYTVYNSKDHLSAHLIDFTKSIENNEDITQECISIPIECYACGEMGENKMCMCTIPFFKELIIICFKCEKCGYKTVEVKGGGGFSPLAKKIIFKVEKNEDLSRDMFKSETAKITIPELEFETDTGSLGSMFTTVEGVLMKIIENLENVPFSKGDSKEDQSLESFIQKLKDVVTNNTKFTLIVDDPASNSFIFSPKFPEVDPQLEVIEYERTWEQNEDLGLNDMKTENYENVNEN